MKIRHLFLFILCLLGVALPQTARAGFQNETLRYVISYKWGAIHKDAGDAVLSLRNNGGNYILGLTARTKPWADKIFQVRDTLNAVLRINGLKPVSYTKSTHEGGKYARDHIVYTHSGNRVTAKCDRIKVKKGKTNRSTKSLAATGSAYDMLSVFYYVRTLNYEKMKSGVMYKTTVFSGSKAESLMIKCLGKERIKLRDKRTVEAWHLRFKFTSDGKKKSSADMDTWVSTDARHVPLLLEGSLPVGKVKCYYIGG